MPSPLAPYINGRLLVPGQGTVTNVNGRWVRAPGNDYLVKLFIKRAQYSGVSSGSRPIPLQSELGGQMMPGASGDQFYYRGYALEWASVASGWDLEVSDETSLTFVQVTTQYPWLSTGTACQFRFGDDPIMFEAKIQRSSGIFGGEGIDSIIYSEIGGVEVQITGGELQN